MNQIVCHKCKQPYDRDTQWKQCPHNPLSVGVDDKYCRRHDLFNCYLCVDQPNNPPMRMFRLKAVMYRGTTATIDHLTVCIVRMLAENGFTVRDPIVLEEAQEVPPTATDVREEYARLGKPDNEAIATLQIQIEVKRLQMYQELRDKIYKLIAPNE